MRYQIDEQTFFALLKMSRTGHDMDFDRQRLVWTRITKAGVSQYLAFGDKSAATIERQKNGTHVTLWITWH